VNLREQLLLYHISKMRANLALAQRRQAAQHQAADNCPSARGAPCTPGTGGSIPGVTVLHLTTDAEAPAVDPNADTKH
jgi:hypothetical protein